MALKNSAAKPKSPSDMTARERAWEGERGSQLDFVYLKNRPNGSQIHLGYLSTHEPECLFQFYHLV
jgi:hypothetical protein